MESRIILNLTSRLHHMLHNLLHQRLYRSVYGNQQTVLGCNSQLHMEGHIIVSICGYADILPAHLTDISIHTLYLFLSSPDGCKSGHLSLNHVSGLHEFRKCIALP